MKRLLGLVVLLTTFVWAQNGMVTYKSRYNVDETTKRLVKVLRQKGVTLFKVIDHGEGANQANVTLPPSKLVIFGNPKMGAPLMACSPTLGLDLPQKMLIYQDPKGQTMVTFNATAYLFWRHSVPASCHLKLQKKMATALKGFAKYAAGVQ
ncbi:MAG: DUF302 domain-containing protein [Hydrogenimonas sp.]|nr:MAG: DUF302 domain-containing protein [Hydrogenimonas sp.]